MRARLAGKLLCFVGERLVPTASFPLRPSSAKLCFVLAGFVLLLGSGAARVRAADPLVDGAVTALAALTNPGRLERMDDEDQFRAQLGPALGWLHVARRRDVSPEAVIARAFAANGLIGDRAKLTREALLRNLARADAWELFGNEISARALADGRPAPIGAGIHRGHLARASVVSPEGPGAAHRDFAWLVLSADDELAPRRTRPYRPQPGDLLARRVGAPAASRKNRPAARRGMSPSGGAPLAVPAPSVYDEPLPVP